MNKKYLCSYSADKGSCVINGLCVENRFGDGTFDVFFADKLPDGFDEVNAIWFDLRDDNVKIWKYDCDKKLGVKTFTKKSLGCDAIKIANSSGGDICLVKYF